MTDDQKMKLIHDSINIILRMDDDKPGFLLFLIPRVRKYTDLVDKYYSNDVQFILAMNRFKSEVGTAFANYNGR